MQIFNQKMVYGCYQQTMFVSKLFDINKFNDNTNRRLINVGSQYRNPISIHCVAMNKKDDFIKFIALKEKKMESNFPPDNFDVVMCDGSLSSDFNLWTNYFIKYINQSPDEYSSSLKKTLTECLSDCVSVNPRNVNSNDLIKDFIDLVEFIPTVINDQFDDLYTENVIFLDLVDASAANTIIECIVRVASNRISSQMTFILIPLHVITGRVYVFVPAAVAA